jgi:hypothetical protein
LNDPDFRDAKLDTGFLDRLLTRKPSETPTDPKAGEVAAIAAGIFAALGASLAAAGERADGSALDKPTATSNWKRAARREGLR